jgi:hypothetical protein
MRWDSMAFLILNEGTGTARHAKFSKPISNRDLYRDKEELGNLAFLIC